MKWGTKPGWNPITPEETRSGRRIAYRACRPSLVFILLICTMIAVVLSILDQFNLLGPGTLFLLVGSWTSIAASETDVNSPLNQTLMDKIRGNLDYLYSVGASIKNIHDSATGGTTVREVYVLDSTVNWIDRNIHIRGIIAWSTSLNASGGGVGSLAEVQKILPGGSEDNDSYFQINQGIAGALTTPTCRHGEPTLAGTNSTDYDFVDGWMYSGAGGNAYNVLPYFLYPGIKGANAATAIYIWVDSATGELKLTCEYGADAAGTKYAAWNLQITYSEDLGGV